MSVMYTVCLSKINLHDIGKFLGWGEVCVGCLQVCLCPYLCIITSRAASASSAVANSMKQNPLIALDDLCRGRLYTEHIYM